MAQQVFYTLVEAGDTKGARALRCTGATIDIRAEGDCAFRAACRNGHLATAQWLLSVCPEIDVRVYQDYAFCWACRNEHLATAQWLIDLGVVPPVDHDLRAYYRQRLCRRWNSLANVIIVTKRCVRRFYARFYAPGGRGMMLAKQRFETKTRAEAGLLQSQ